MPITVTPMPTAAHGTRLKARYEWVPGYRKNATETRTADKARLTRQTSISPAPVDMAQEEPQKIS